MSDPARPTRFFYTGGALPPEAPSYIRRAADDQLFERLQQGEYCYVLVSRQMGKSSLMVHTLTRLVRQNITAVMVDLNAIGDDTTQEQWYYSLTEQLAGQLGLKEQTTAFWDRSESKTALQRWVGAIEQILRLYPHRPLVIFIDEIDQVRSLAFRTDEFFASIRSFHNRRVTEPAFKRLTFCLIGVALPSDLIEDPRITPFNIAERIDLIDFSEEQILALKAGLQREEIQEEALLQRVFYWANGHPYLTQRLCRAIVEDASVQTAQDVDRLCGCLFFGTDAAAPDDNINLVGTRLLHSDPDVMGLMTLYQRIALGKKVSYNRANRLINMLMLAGAIRSTGGTLQIRNRIYGTVFSAKWALDNMPGAVLRLQRQAYRRGLLRALAIASIVIAILGILLYRTYRAEIRANVSDRNSRHALDTANGELYIANMSLAQKAYGEGNIPRAQEILDECRDRPGLARYRGFEWHYLWGRLHQDRYTLEDHGNKVSSIAFSSDGRTVISVDMDATIRRWSVETGQKRDAVTHRYRQVAATAISADGGTVAIAPLDKTVRLQSAVSGQANGRLIGLKHSISSMALSRDGRLLAVGTYNGPVTLWQVSDGRCLQTIPGNRAWWDTLAFSPNGKALFASDGYGAVWLRDVATGHLLANLKRSPTRTLAVAFSPDGSLLATGAQDGKVHLWDLERGVSRRSLSGHSTRVTALAFSSDSRTLGTGGADATVRLWDIISGTPIRTLRGHRDVVACLAFSPNRHVLATGSDDRTSKLWDLTTKNKQRLGKKRPPILCLNFIPDGRTLAISSTSGPIKLWDPITGCLLTTLAQGATAMASSSDGHKLITADAKGGITSIDLESRRQIVLYPNAKGIRTLALTPTGNEVAIGGGEGAIRCLDTRTGNLIRTISSPLAGVLYLAFSPDGRLLAACDQDEGGILMDYATGRTLFHFGRRGEQCSSLCFSPNSRQMAIGFSDGIVELRDTPGVSEGWRASAQIGKISAIAFSPDGSNLVTGGDDHKVHVWNVRMEREVWTLEGHNDNIIGLNFTPDGSLVSIDQDRYAILWPAL